MPQTLRVPLADLELAAPVQTTSTIRVPLADLTLVPPPASVAPRVSTPLPAAATRGMLPPSTMAGDPAPFNAPRVATARPPQPVSPPEPIETAGALGTLRKATGITAAPERGITARAASAGRFFGAGVLSAGAVIPAFAEAAGDVLGLPSLTEWGRSRGQAVQQEIESLRKAPGAGETEQAVLSGVESMGLAIPTLALAGVGGGEVAALGIFGAVSGSG